MTEKILYLTLITLTLYSCSDSSSKDNSRIRTSTNYEYGKIDNNEDTNNSTEMTQQMYLCPMCQGGKQIRHFYTGEIMDCPACQGAGQVSAEIIQQMQEARQMGENIANDIINEQNNDYQSGDNMGSGDDITMELKQCEREKASIEEQMEYVESVTTRSYLSSQLVILNTRIAQLQRALQNAY